MYFLRNIVIYALLAVLAFILYEAIRRFNKRN